MIDLYSSSKHKKITSKLVNLWQRMQLFLYANWSNAETLFEQFFQWSDQQNTQEQPPDTHFIKRKWLQVKQIIKWQILMVPELNENDWIHVGTEGNSQNEIIRYCCTLVWGESIFFLHWVAVSIADQISKFH